MCIRDRNTERQNWKSRRSVWAVPLLLLPARLSAEVQGLSLIHIYWVQLGTDENGILMNRYFVEHPEMILGEMKMVSGRFGPEATCAPYEGADLAEQLGEAVSNIHGELTAYEVEDDLAEEDNSMPADPTVRNFSYTAVSYTHLDVYKRQISHCDR